MCVLLHIYKDYKRIETLLSREGKLRTVKEESNLGPVELRSKLENGPFSFHLLLKHLDANCETEPL